MLNFKSYLLSAFHIALFLSVSVEFSAAKDGSTNTMVNIGVVLDLESPLASMVDLCISMAVSDFYSLHSHYQTRLSLHPKYADKVLDAASAVLGLLKNEKVHAIVGPQSSTEATFAAQVGEKAHVPVISFTARCFSGSPSQNPYFVQTALDDSYQAKALAAICQRFKWREVVVIHEDTDYGNQFVSRLMEPFQEAKISLCYMSSISPSVDDSHILKELNKLMTLKSRVFLVHMNIPLGTRLFFLAKELGLMSKGYAWIITDSLSNVLNSMNSTVIDPMEGVLGIRPYVPQSKNLEQFKARWKRNMPLVELNVYGFWAYDTIWALAMAVEKIGHINPSFSRSKHTSNGTDITNLGVSKLGPNILREILLTKFEGLSGDFQIVDGQLQASAFEIINVIGPGDRTVGYWTADRGIVRDLEYHGKPKDSTATETLKSILWPGDTFEPPIGWAPKVGKLKVGVPKKYGFYEFVNVHEEDPLSNQTRVTGFTIDIFVAAIAHLAQLNFPLDYEFVPFVNESGQSSGSYNEMLYKIKDATYDIVVGDTTILVDRAQHVDFALPYSESGLVMVVKNKKDINMWIFVKPLRWDLWVTIAAACIFIGVTLRILEHQPQGEPLRPQAEQLGLHFWFPIAALAFPERNMVVNNWSRFVLVMWLFMAFILMQSYTAKLSAIFTVDQLQFAFHEDFNVGHQDGSFVKDLLINKLHFNHTKLKQYSTIEEYHDAMIIGSKNGGIDAIFDETPYMKLFVRRYGNRYRMIGQTYKTDGFGFAFPLDSPLVPHFSRAILNVTQGPNMSKIELTNFGPEYVSGYEDSSISQESPSLTASNFGGLFIIVGSATVFALFCSMTTLGQYLCQKVNEYANACFSFPLFNRLTRGHPLERDNHREDDLPALPVATEEIPAANANTTNGGEGTDQGGEIYHSDEGSHGSDSDDNDRVAGEVELPRL